MGVVVRMDAYVPAGVNPAKAFRTAFDRVADLARRLSSYREDSELRQVERLAWQGPVEVSEAFGRVLGAALRLARASGGAFDPTVGSVTRLVRGESATADGRGGAALESAWRRTGWELVELDTERRTVLLRSQGLLFDFGGIAKGFIADEALDTLKRSGVRRALVSIAGDIVAGEAPPMQQGWMVALDAAGPKGTIEERIILRHQGVSTSGSRERNYQRDGRRCSHIVTRTSDLCADTAAAVSVVAPTGMEADGLATALVALGRDRSKSLLAGRPGVRAYWTGSGLAGDQDQ